MILGEVVIDRRFRGPNDSGNGGYSCGLLGVRAGNPSEVRLRRPPPLTRPLRVEEDDGVLRLLDGPDVVAEARSVERVEVDVPESPVSFAAAERSATPMQDFFPQCFVCGAARAAGDGLRIFAGPVPERDGVFAAPWIPDESLGAADDADQVAGEFVWASLDCPTASPVLPTVAPDRAIVLGTLAVERRQPVRVGQPHVLMSWLQSSSEKVGVGAAAVLREDGEVCAVSRGLWVLIDRSRFAAVGDEERGG